MSKIKQHEALILALGRHPAITVHVVPHLATLLGILWAIRAVATRQQLERVGRRRHA